jgi:hypothetical protein
MLILYDISFFPFQGVLFTFVGINYSENIKSSANSTHLSNHHDDKDDAEEDFPKRNSQTKNVGWSIWSEWATCSRTCDGGVTFQLRRCHSPHGCKGDAVRYKICNMQVSSCSHTPTGFMYFIYCYCIFFAGMS